MMDAILLEMLREISRQIRARPLEEAFRREALGDSPPGALLFMQPEFDANYERVKAEVWEWENA